MPQLSPPPPSVSDQPLPLFSSTTRLRKMYIPLLSTVFPEPRNGPFATGYEVLRLRTGEPYAAPTPRRKDGSPVMRLSETVVAVYYPTKPTWWRFRGNGVRWLPEPTEGMFTGYRIFLGWFVPVSALLWLVCKILVRPKMPVHPAAAVAPHNKPFPLVVFSHGLSGTRNTYSQMCQRLVSEGYVVLAVEHADGSGPCVIRDGKSWTFTKLDETVWPEKDDGSPPYDRIDLRACQLDFRVREVYEAYAAFCRLMAGSQADMEIIEGSPEVVGALRGRVDIDNVKLMGHSFGGGTLMRLLTTVPPHPYTAMPLEKAIVLDPWYEPGAIAPTLPPPSTPVPPTMIINSQQWTEREDFPMACEEAKGISASLCTIMGMRHNACSDFGLLTLPGRATSFLDQIHGLITGHLTNSPHASLLARPDGGDVQFTRGKMPRGSFGEIRVHFSGKTESPVEGEAGETGEAHDESTPLVHAAA